jgi:CHAD domain-containing protein
MGDARSIIVAARKRADSRLSARSRIHATSLKGCLRRLHQELTSSLERLRRQVTTEGVHQARIAIRRMLALLQVFKTEFDPLQIHRYRRTLKQVMRTLGRCRDVDILHRGMVELTAAAKGRRRDVLEALGACLADQRLSSSLDLQAWMEDRCRSQWPVAPAAGDQLPSFIASASLERLRRRLRAKMHKSKMTSTSLHRLRIKVKILRYALENLELLGHAPRSAPEIAALTRLQGSLGKLHDLQQLRHALRGKRARRRVLKKTLLEMLRRRRHLLHEYETQRAMLFELWSRTAVRTSRNASRKVPSAPRLEEC